MDILKRLDASHARLLESVSPLDEEIFRKSPGDGAWSVGEIVLHLSLVEERVIKELELALQKPPRQLGLLRRLVPTSIVASRLIKVKSPNAVAPSKLGDKQETVKALNDARSKLKSLYDKHGEARLAQTVFKHPFLGEITGVATISFVGYHEQRHYKQICEVIKKLNYA